MRKVCLGIVGCVLVGTTVARGQEAVPPAETSKTLRQAVAVPESDVVRADLRPRFTVGQEVVYEHTLTSTKTEGVNLGGGVKVKTKVIREYAVRVDRILEDGSAKFTFTMQRFRFHATAADTREFDFDSELGIPERRLKHSPILRLLDAVGRVKLQGTIDATGKVVALTGLDAIESLAIYARSMGSLAHETWFVAAIEGIYRVSEGVQSRVLGETWTVEKQAKAAGKEAGSHRITKTLDAIEDGEARIVGTSVVDLDLPEPEEIDADSPEQIYVSGVKVMEQSHSSVVRWDLETGMLVASSMEQTATIAGKMQGLRVSQQTEATSELRRIK